MRLSPALRCRRLAGSALALLLAGIVQAQGLSPAQPLRVVVFPSPGLFDVASDGSVSGPGGALITKIGHVSGLALQTQVLPVPRAIATGLIQADACLIGLMRTPERETQFQWAGPLSSGALVVYGRQDEDRPPRSLADLKGRAVVAIRDSGPALQLRELGVLTQEVSGTVPALRMLQARRVDFWFAHAFIAESAAAAEGGPPIKAWLAMPKVDGYLGCHPHVPSEVVERLQQAIHKLRRQGDLAEFGLR